VFPQCTQLLREGRLSLDQVGVIASRAADGSDAHYAELACVATVNQLRTAVNLEPKPKPEPQPEPDPDDEFDVDADAQPDPRPEPAPSITHTADEQYTYWRITLPHLESATFDAALASHRDALMAEWKHDHGGNGSAQRPPLPTTGDAFMRLVEAGWDTEAARRPHGQHTTVVAHLDVADRVAALHLGALLSDAERQYLTCDATCEVWFERDGQPLGAGRTTRLINRRLRRALEYRHRTCAVGIETLHVQRLIHCSDWPDAERTAASWRSARYTVVPQFRGKPSPRWAMMLRWISDVPPATVPPNDRT
jgi:Domain of unknown function (DUF222)